MCIGRNLLHELCLAAACSCLLRSLERVLRTYFLFADAFALVGGARRGLRHDDVLVRRARDGAADEDAAVFFENAEELKVLLRDLLVAHLTGHALALVHALRRETA